MGKETYKILIQGIVQGVGFRPFIYQLAYSYQIMGYVSNTSQGVEIIAQGYSEQLNQFIADIGIKKPILSRIQKIIPEKIVTDIFYQDFIIQHSSNHQARTAWVPSDMAICQDCLRELLHPEDRRFRYPFINCTNCGPRYTIIGDLPYDRAMTAMANFSMCPTCQAEYENPMDRRFHAQPNACWDCGPILSLCNSKGEYLVSSQRIHDKETDPILLAVQMLQEGKIIAIKGIGGFHLAVNAKDEMAVSLLRKRKGRYAKPLAVMVANLEVAQQLSECDEYSAQVLQSPNCPIVLLPKKESDLAYSIATNHRVLGVFLPYTPIHHLLLQDGLSALVMTSGNRSEEPIAISNQQALSQLGGIADVFLLHNRDIYYRCDDSVQMVVKKQSSMIRRSRGYVPQPIVLPKNVPSVLGYGAELKNTICFTRNDCAFLSPHIGDLENPETFDFFLHTIEHFQSLLGIQPVAIGYDLHPNYFNSQYAQQQKKLPIFPIQHHFAHIVSCMAENGITEPVLGIALDGTGYGVDGTIWGGEILQTSLTGFHRLAHLETIAMSGGDTAARYPWRMALAYLFHTFGRENLPKELAIFQNISEENWQTCLEILEKNMYCIPTSSCGRLFDAVSAMLGIQYTNEYEGQSAILLENCAWESSQEECYPLPIFSNVTPIAIPVDFLIHGIVDDIRNHRANCLIARKFHYTLAQLLSQTVGKILSQTKLQKICLSGGVFQNQLLTQLLTAQLEYNYSVQVYTQHSIPCNDAGISLGQAVSLAYQLDGGTIG